MPLTSDVAVVII